MFKMRAFFVVFASIFVIMPLVGCGDDNSTGGPGTETKCTKWEAWEVTPATCSAPGDSTRICTTKDIDSTDTRIIPKLSGSQCDGSGTGGGDDGGSQCGSEGKIDGGVLNYEGESYPTVIIDGKRWMAKNLNYAGVSGNAGVCYNNSPDSCAKYGRLYSWAEAMNLDLEFNDNMYNNGSAVHQGICPSGWHISTHKEWEDLVDCINTSTTGYNNAGGKLRSETGWSAGAGLLPLLQGTDDFGFSALPGGRNVNGSFSQVGTNAIWWSATEYSDYGHSAYYRSMFNNNDRATQGSGFKMYMYSVRCVEN